jgi:hypothetical protein
MRKLVIAAAMVGMTAALAIAPAEAANDICKNVRIRVQNDHPTQVKVTGMRYRDYDSEGWRKERIVNRKIATTKQYTWTRDLEHVKNDDTFLAVWYREHQGGTRWGELKSARSPNKVCTEGALYSIVIP